MKNLVYAEHELVNWVNASGGTLLSGRMVSIGGNEIGVLQYDLANNENGTVRRRGIVSYARLTGGGTAWTAGMPLFYDNTNNRLTKVNAAGLVYAGIAHKAAADADVAGEIILNAKAIGAATADGAAINTLLANLRAAGLIAAS